MSKPIQSKNKRISPLTVTLIVFGTLFAIYVALVGVWDATSVHFKPVNALDFAVKTPAQPRDWFDRREHAVKK